MADGAHLLRFKHAAHLEHDRGGSLVLVAREQWPFGQYQMHARCLDAIDRLDCTGQFTFERAQVIDVLHETGGAERVAFIEDLVADAAALWQAAFCKLHSQPRHHVLRNEDAGAIVAQLVLHALVFELGSDRGGIIQGEIGEQWRHLRRCHAQDHEGEKPDQRECDGAHRRDPRGAERFDEFRKALHGSPCL